MDQFGVTALADWLEEQSDALLSKKTIINLDRVYKAVDYLNVLKNTAAAYPEMSEETYLKTESDKKLSLLDDHDTLAELEDRIMVNHVDGSISGSDFAFKYNHDTPFVDGKYNARKDLEILKFGLEVVGAVTGASKLADVTEALSPDAAVSFLLAANAFHKWQLTE